MNARVGHPTLVVAPTAPFVTLDDAKRHLRIHLPVVDDNDIVESYIGAASGDVEGWRGVTGRCFRPQTWATKHQCWDRGGCFASPFPDIISVEVKYLDVAGVERTLPAESVQIVGEEVFVGTGATALPLLKSRVANDHAPRVTVEWTCGFDPVPEDIKLAVKMLVAHYYENREAVVPNERRVEYEEMPMGAARILKRYDTGFVV